MGENLRRSATAVAVAAGSDDVVVEPSVVAVERDGTSIAAAADGAPLVGREAVAAQQREPSRLTLHGVVDGDDPARFEAMLRHLLSALGGRADPGCVLVSIPSDAPAHVRESRRTAAQQLGAAKAFLVPEHLAAAIGADLPVAAPEPCALLDLGAAGATLTVLRLAGTVREESVGPWDAERADGSAIRDLARAIDGSLARARETTGGDPAAWSLVICGGGAHGVRRAELVDAIAEIAGLRARIPADPLACAARGGARSGV